MTRILDLRLSIPFVSLFLRLAAPYPKRFYWFSVAADLPAGSLEICLYSQDEGMALALHFIHWSKLCWITRNNSKQASSGTASS